MKSLKVFIFISLVFMLSFQVCLGFSVNDGSRKGSATKMTPGSGTKRTPMTPGQRPASQPTAAPTKKGDIINPLQVKTTPSAEADGSVQTSPVMPSKREKPKNNVPLFIGIIVVVGIAVAVGVNTMIQKQREKEF